jgi:hypothetical protein
MVGKVKNGSRERIFNARSCSEELKVGDSLEVCTSAVYPFECIVTRSSHHGALR